MNTTPGPWKVRNGKIIHETERGFIEVVGPDYKNADELNLAVAIAVYLPPTSADAQLIASAPDLLAACEAMVHYRERNTLNFQLEKLDDFVDIMRAAIARAKGDGNDPR